MPAPTRLQSETSCATTISKPELSPPRKLTIVQPSISVGQNSNPKQVHHLLCQISRCLAPIHSSNPVLKRLSPIYSLKPFCVFDPNHSRKKLSSASGALVSSSYSRHGSQLICKRVMAVRWQPWYKPEHILFSPNCCSDPHPSKSKPYEGTRLNQALRAKFHVGWVAKLSPVLFWFYI